jgi:hypothetical protein
VGVRDIVNAPGALTEARAAIMIRPGAFMPAADDGFLKGGAHSWLEGPLRRRWP